MKILCYHGVTKYKNYGVVNFSKKHISKNEFYQQIKYIKKNFNILSIEEIYTHILKKIPFKKNSVSITFDDGFKNNFDVAVPILKKFQVPAIFYICPQIIEKQEMFWVDKIEACIVFYKKKKFLLNINKKKKKFDIKNNKKKIKTINEIKKICKKTNDLKKDQIINDLIINTAVKPSIKLNENYKVATWSQINKIIKNKLFTIGGHSLTHSIFTKLTLEKLERDINNTIKLIKKRTGYTVKHFSYPEGKYNNTVIKILKKNKILSSPIASGFNNTFLQDPFKLKRIMVGFEEIKFPFKKFK